MVDRQLLANNQYRLRVLFRCQDKQLTANQIKNSCKAL